MTSGNWQRAEGACRIWVKDQPNKGHVSTLTLVDDLGDEGVLVLGLDAHALPAGPEVFAVVVGLIPVVLPAPVVAPGEVVVAVFGAQVQLRGEVRGHGGRGRTDKIED